MAYQPPTNHPAITTFRHAAVTALSTHDRPSFESAFQTLCTAIPTALNQTLATDPHLASLINLAADRHWIEPLTTQTPPPPPPSTSWASVAKRSRASFLPNIPDKQHIPQPHRHSSFRRWKWHAGSITPSAQISAPASPDQRLPNSDSSSIASTSSPHSVVRHLPHPSALSARTVLEMDPINNPAPATPAFPYLDPTTINNTPNANQNAGGANADFEAALLSGMPRLEDARPAGAAAAAAFRALAPFLPMDERVALRQAFGVLSPIDCLAMVVRVAEVASEKGRREGVGALGGLPGGGGVWGSGGGGGQVAWEGVYRNKGNGLDVHAPPFQMGGGRLRDN
eukprot:GFKZ01003222.1.p1 GENE.GFKZ01003222.1~~GFKZ01003222.1.p1  ORF type:complete len:361 (-),score=57.67 GFKZ01003222.1:313-1332(-)